ncbi:tyrosine-protein phosphatase [Aureimonas glaciei]|jgi:protein tyrosine/serine phosphatase|uniref:Tyrosine/serine protein phosphatase n=1 Tax=Aureimonas glaciei TaxID=1776957 RepID=A0A916XVG9_9HYPH|nr:tyrosine-protein phosphatase [Aureimonas glaciei]GGD15821.1 tyrosine/serine protein phosphatase [Aureimonas glaciei]
MPPLLSRLRRVVLTTLVVLSVPLGYAGLHYARGNIFEIQPGVLYRSGQLDGTTLQRLIEQKGIRTIVNLRGAHPGERWFEAEASIAEGNGIHYTAIPLSARSVPAMATMDALALLLRDSPGPVLVHCLGGSDRSGLAAAIYELVVRGKSEAEAAGQLSIVYGHFPWLGSATGAMDDAFAQFADHWHRDKTLVSASGDVGQVRMQ